MAARQSLYLQVVDITSEYLGPAAERFISRQISNHLQIKPTQLTKSNLAKLIDWIQAAMTVLTDDDQLVDEYITRLEQLTRRQAAADISAPHYIRSIQG
jgi:hypothetical protein